MPFKRPCTAHAFHPERMSNHCQGLHNTFPEICTKCYAVPLSDSSRNRIRSHRLLQIKGCKKSSPPSSCVKFCTLTLKICYTIIYCCIALLQLLYRWQQQTRKLWIPLIEKLSVMNLFLHTEQSSGYCSFRFWNVYGKEFIKITNRTM
jgi:hypothetical protein